MTTLAVAIPTYNGRHLLEQTLASYLEQTRPPDRLIVVDDGSSDGTVPWLAEVWPQVEVIVNPVNRGIAASLNVCLAAGLDCDYVGLFNNDVELGRDALAELCHALDGHPEAAASGPKMLNYYDRGLIDGAGDYYCWTATGHRRGHGERDAGQYDEAEEFFGVCGGAAVYRSAVLCEIGLLDERFYAYYEDVDWNLRAYAAGYRARYVPRAVVFHMSSATTGYGINPFSSYHAWRNALWVVANNWSTREILLHLPFLLLTQAWNLQLAWRNHLLATFWRATRHGLRGWGAHRAGRRDRPAGAAALALPLSPRRATWGR